MLKAVDYEGDTSRPRCSKRPNVLTDVKASTDWSIWPTWPSSRLAICSLGNLVRKLCLVFFAVYLMLIHVRVGSSFLDLLLACLAWFEMFWSNTAGGYGASLDSFDDDETTAFMLPEDFVAAVSEAVRHLIASFDNFVKSHRRTHGLTGAHVSRVRVLVPVFFF
jgi:hypothetical protein